MSTKNEINRQKEVLAASLPSEELNCVGFRLYERFRPDVPEGAQGGVRRGSCGLSGLLGRWGDCRSSSTGLRTRWCHGAATVQTGKVMTVATMGPAGSRVSPFSSA